MERGRGPCEHIGSSEGKLVSGGAGPAFQRGDPRGEAVTDSASRGREQQQTLRVVPQHSFFSHFKKGSHSVTPQSCGTRGAPLWKGHVKGCMCPHKSPC